MGKKWFVFRNNHHWGPYSLEEMGRYRRLGHLKDEDLVWKEGLEDWVPLKEQEALRGLGEEEISPPVVPETSVVPPPPKGSPRPEKKRFRFLGLGVAVTLCVLAGLGLFYFPREGERPSLAKLNAVERANIEHILESGEDIHHMALSDDESGLWFVFGKRVSGEVSIYLTSRRGEILADGPVEVFSSGHMVEGVGHFEDFEVLRGTGLVPGKYDYRILIEPRNLVAQAVSYLQKYPFFEGHEWMRSLPGTIRLVGTFYHYAESEENFHRRLSVFNRESLFQRRGLPLIDQLEKLRVFYAMMKKIKEIFDEQLPQAREGEDFGGLKDHYMRKISPLLQRIVTDGHEKAVALMDSDIEAAREHLEIFEVGREVVGFMGQRVQEMVAVEEYTQEVRDAIQSKFSEDYERLLSKLHTVLEKKKEQARPFLDESPSEDTPREEGVMPASEGGEGAKPQG